ncbi:hypothetical protein G9F71_025700 [Clostridium sp. FP2]|uniref:hypothetical protein n=1 Tax=Clostridium sp. FP2 TaxID=2724481 RepID=UPI0013E94E87|nr:hypothetical protein [Clostridium sp. FP2]MBZ9626203.1 hypothetical protein [Clostridium sp. FP2]
MNKKFISKVLGVALVASMLMPQVAHANGRDGGQRYPVWYNEVENNDSRDTANKFSVDMAGVNDLNSLFGMKGNLKCGDTDFFKLQGAGEYNTLRIDVDVSQNVTFNIIDEEGNPVDTGVERDSYGNGKINLDLSNKKIYYLRLTTGIQGNSKYVLVGYASTK